MQSTVFLPPNAIYRVGILHHLPSNHPSIRKFWLTFLTTRNELIEIVLSYMSPSRFWLNSVLTSQAFAKHSFASVYACEGAKQVYYGRRHFFSVRSELANAAFAAQFVILLVWSFPFLIYFLTPKSVLFSCRIIAGQTQYRKSLYKVLFLEKNVFWKYIFFECRFLNTYQWNCAHPVQSLRTARCEV